MRKLALATIISALLAPATAQALGLGDIETQSALNQPLEAEIELLSVRKGETDGMIVTLASQEAFLRAGIDRPFYLTQLRFTLDLKADGTPFIRVFSDRPIVEPFLNFLVEVDWPRGRLLREYTVLLDPPVFMAEQAVSGSAQPALGSAAQSRPAAGVPARIDRGGEAMAQPAPAPLAPPPAATLGTTQPSSTTAPPPAAPFGVVGEYGPIQANETLWVIAGQVRSSDVTHQQMMIALLQENPEAFYDNNINRLKRGWVLRVPDPAAVAAIGRDSAIAMVREQNSRWEAYRQNLQARAGGPGAAPRGGAGQGSGAGLAGDGRLAIVTADSSTQSAVGTSTATELPRAAQDAQQQLALAQEELAAERLANQELSDRIGSLEQIVAKMERLITIRESQLAELQVKMAELQGMPAPTQEPPARADEPPAQPGGEPISVADAGAGAEPAAEPTTEAGAEMAPPPAGQTEAAGAASGPAQTLSAAAESEPAAATDTAAATAEPVPAGQQTAADAPPAGAEGAAATVQAGESTITTAAAPVMQPPKLPRSLERPAPMTHTEGGGLLDLLRGPMGMAAGGAAVLLLVAGWLMMRRKRAAGDEPAITPADQPFEVDQTLAEELEAAAAEHQATTLLEQPAVAAPEDAEGAEPAPIEETAVDIGETLTADVAFDEAESDKDETIAEADVYLAYSLYSQAEELLKGAIADKPDRLDYKEKLLETYYAARDKRAFEAGALAFHQALQGKPHRLWDRVVAMGGDLCPDNELFKGAGETGIHVEDLQPSKPETPDFDLDADDAAFAADIDFGADEQPEEADLEFAMEDSEPDTMDLPDLGTGEVEVIEDEAEDKSAADGAKATVTFDTSSFLDEGTERESANDEGAPQTTGQYLAADIMDDLLSDEQFPDTEEMSLAGTEELTMPRTAEMAITDDEDDGSVAETAEMPLAEGKGPDDGLDFDMGDLDVAGDSTDEIAAAMASDDEAVEALMEKDDLDELLDSDDEFDQDIVTAEFKMVEEQDLQDFVDRDAEAAGQPDDTLDFGAEEDLDLEIAPTDQLPAVEDEVQDLDLDGSGAADERAGRLISEEVPVISDDMLDGQEQWGGDGGVTEPTVVIPSASEARSSEEPSPAAGDFDAPGAEDEEPLLVSQEMPLISDDMLADLGEDEADRSEPAQADDRQGRYFSGSMPAITDEMLESANLGSDDEPELVSMEMPTVDDDMLAQTAVLDEDATAFESEDTAAFDQPPPAAGDGNGAGGDELQATIAQTQDFDPFDDSEDSAALSDEGDEVDTLLDLARAYIEMGDSDSAGSALKEIVETGNDRQKAEANELLRQLSA